MTDLISRTFSAVSIKSSNDAFTITSTFDGTQVLKVNTATKTMTVRDTLLVDTIRWNAIDPSSGGLPPVAQSMPRVVEVHPDLASATIAAGISAALALVPPPSNSNPVVVRIYPGAYIEDNTVPIVVPTGVNLCGLCSETVLVVPSQPGTLFNITADVTSVSNLRFENTTGAIVTAITVSGTATLSDLAFYNFDKMIVPTSSSVVTINDCLMVNNGTTIDTDTAIEINNILTTVNVTNTSFMVTGIGNMITGIGALNGNIAIRNCEFADCDDCINIDGGNASIENCKFNCAINIDNGITMSSGSAFISDINCVRTGGTFSKGIFVGGGSVSAINDVTTDGLNNAVELENVASKLEINNLTAANSINAGISLDNVQAISINNLCVSAAIRAIQSVNNSVFILQGSTIDSCTSFIEHQTSAQFCQVSDCKVTGTSIGISMQNAKLNLSDMDISGATLGVDFSGSSNMTISGCNFDTCATGVRSVSNTPGGISTINNCTFTLGDVACDISSSQINIMGCTFSTQNNSTITAGSSSTVQIYSSSISGDAPCGICASNAGTRIRLYSVSMIVDMPVGILLSDQATLEMQGSTLKFASVGIDDDGTSTININDCVMNNTKNFGDDVNIDFLSGNIDTNNSRQTTQLGTVFGNDVGTNNTLDILNGGLRVGGNGSYGSNYRILTDDGGGTFADETDNSQFGAGFSYSSTGINAAIYLGATDKFSGFRYDIVDTVSSYGDYVVEYWNGAMWSQVLILCSETGAPYISLADNIFTTNGNSSGNETTRLGYPVNGPWVMTTVNGINLYWIRIRITNAITTSPTLSKLSLTWHSRYVNSNGFCEYFGNARPVKLINMRGDAQDSMPGSIDPVPGTVNVGFNIAFSNDRIKFPPATETKKIWRIHLPPDIDTSMPIDFNWSWYKSSLPADDNINSIEWAISYFVTEPDTSIDESGALLPNRPTIISFLQSTMSPVSNAQYNSSRLLIANNSLPLSVLWIFLTRSGLDSNGSDAVVFQPSICYTSWRDGGYVKYQL